MVGQRDCPMLNVYFVVSLEKNERHCIKPCW